MQYEGVRDPVPPFVNNVGGRKEGRDVFSRSRPVSRNLSQVREGL